MVGGMSLSLKWRRKNSNISSLPEELVFNILVRLRADHLYHIARLVCRRWYLIIRSHAFINAHLQHSSYRLVLCPHSRWSYKPIFVTATEAQIETREFDYKCRYGIWTSCNGLTIECHVNNAIDMLSPHIINPATDQAFNLPSIDHCRPVLLGSSCIAYSVASMAYKVIIPQGKGNSLYILTVGVDDSWRHVEIPHHVQSRPFVSEGGGFIHWVDPNKVLTLNVETEIITSSHTPLLQPQAYQSKYYLSTGTHLSLLVAHHDFSWDVWEMKQENGEWRKLLANIKLDIQPANQVLAPIGWVKYPQVLAFLYQRRRTCIFYNLDTHRNNCIDLGFHGFDAFVHRNTLVNCS